MKYSVRDKALRLLDSVHAGYYARSLSTIGRFLVERALYRHAEAVVPFVAREPLTVTFPVDRQADNRCEIPRIVWMYWHRGTPTHVVSLVKSQLERLNPQHDIRLISRDTIARWLPDFRTPNEVISIQHFSDILRLDLLARYGGIWCDASLVFFVPFDDLFAGRLTSPHVDDDLLAFYIERFSARLDPPIVENWFLAAPPQSPVILAWQAALEPMRVGGERAMSSALKALPEYTALKQHLLMEDYLVSHIALQHALAGMRAYTLCLERAEDEAFALQVVGDWDPYDLVRRLLAQPYTAELPRVIKLAGYDRHLADLIMRRGIEHPRSLLGRLSRG